MRFVVLLIASLALSAVGASAVMAQHAHGATKGPNGGQVEDVAGVHAELVATGSTVRINVLDEANKPLPTKGYTGSALVVAGSQRETVTLAPAGDNVLEGTAKVPLAGATVSITLKTAAGKSGQARFKPLP
jgi:nitrogen fixation protein FixH